MKLTNNEWLRAGIWMKVCLIVLGLVGMELSLAANGQAVSTTTVQGTVYLANGQTGAGTLTVSWPAFSTASGQSVAAGRTNVTIAADGFLSVNLAPNQGATPAGLYYTAVFYLSDGSTNTQYWVVPAAAQASLAQVQAQLMPAAQAVQAVSKSYVDQSLAELSGSLLTATGGNLSGPLYLNADPTQALQAADKHYVDSIFSEAVPLSGGNMTGALTTPALNGVEAPVAGTAQGTVQAAVTAAGANGAVTIPPNYAGSGAFTNSNGVYVNDLRTSGAQQVERSVKEFGAVCDGVTDDTNALQTALSYANAHGVSLTIPQGTCKTRSLTWHGESIGGLGKQVSALMGFPGQDVLVSGTDSMSMLSYTRIHDLTIYVDQSGDISCAAAKGRAPAGSCAVSRQMEINSIFSPGGSGLTGTLGTGAAWSVGNCAIAMPAVTGAGGNGLRVAEIENLEIATTGTDPMAAQYPGARSTHTCGMYLAQWPQWSEFRNIDIRGLNTGIAIPALPGTAPAGLNADSNRWQNITIQATHGFTAAAGSNNVLDNVVAIAGNSAATAEPPTGLVLDFAGAQQGWTVRNAVVLPSWNAVQPALTLTAAGGAVTAVTAGSEHGLGFDPYGTQVPLKFSGSCTAQAVGNVNSDGSMGTISVTQGGVGCSGTTTASVNVAGNWDTAAPVNLISGQNMTFFAGNLLKGNGGYTVWNAANSQSNGTQLNGGGGTLPGGGAYPALVENNPLGSASQVEQFAGVDFGAKLVACLNTLSGVYGGTCDARNFTGSLSMGSNLTISTANATVLLPCATISTANQVIVTAGTRNVTLRGCALRGASTASGSQGGTVFLYSGTGAMFRVGDPTYAVDTPGFHLDDVVINTTAASNATAQGLVAYRTQEMSLDGLYLLGNSNQTGITLDGTGNYTGGSFSGIQLTGFQTAVNGTGHQISNPATTDWLNASTFVRLHIDCPTSGGSPITGTYGINLQAGDGNTFTGGDVEGCDTAMHLGASAENNTIVGLRNENSNNQVVADSGSSFNNWMTGGTMFTGKLIDNGGRNSFLDTFHRSFNGLNGDWYGSQKDATVTNHYRLGIGSGNERGLLNRYQTDYGYRWTMGLSDAAGGAQGYQVLDELNNVYRLWIGQYLGATANTVTNVILNNGGCYTSATPPSIAFSGGGGSGAAATAVMATSGCSGGYTVSWVTITNGGTQYTSQPTVTFTGSNQISAPNAVAEITTSGSANNQTVINAAGTGAVVLNGSSNSGTGGVVVGSGGSNAATVATIGNTGNAQFNGTLMVGGTSQSTGTMTVRNNADSEVDYYLWPGLTTSQKGSFTYKDWNGNSQWYMVKDASNNWALNSAIGGLDSFKAYQSTNSGDTYINASSTSGLVRINYENGAGTGFNIYGGNSSSLYASFTGTNAIKFPGLAASNGYNCLQIDSSGYITNSGAECGSSSGASGTVSSGTAGQLAYYSTSGTTVSGVSTVPVTAGGTGAATAGGGLANLGGVSLTGGTLTGALTAPQFNGPLAGNASTATALAATPAQCPAGQYATGVTAAGTANCAQTTYSQLGGTAPTWNQNTTGTANNVTGTVAIANGGTGAISAAAALTNLGAVPTTTTVNGHALSGNVTVSASDLTTGTLPHAQLPALASGDIPNNAANTTGTSSNVTGTVAVANGGTGASTAAGAMANLLPGVTSNGANGVNVSGNGQVNGTLQVAGNTTVKNQADAEVDYILWPGLMASQKGSFTYKDWNGNSQWYMMKDASNNWALNSAIGGLDSFKAYQSTNSGDTYINASNSSGTVRINYESGSGTAFNVYGGSSSSLYASFSGTTAIKFPGLAASSGHNCVQIDNSGYITNTGVTCGTVNSGTAGQIAYYSGAGTAVFGINTVPITAGGTGAATAAAALTSLGAVAVTTTVNGHALSGNVTVSAFDITTGTLPHAQLPALVSGDVPNNGANTTGTASNVTGTVGVGNGGTGAATAAGALANLGGLPLTGGTLTGALTATQFNGPLAGNASTASALAATPTQCMAGQYANGVTASGAANCTQVTYSQIGGTVPTWNQSTTGTASNVTGTVAVANGGTGAITATGALSSLGAVPTTTTVNGHALSGNVTVSASDLTTGTLPHAQLPALVSGDIPNNGANTTGTASNVTGTVGIGNGGTGATSATGALTSIGAFAYPGAAGIPYGLTSSTSRSATAGDLTTLLGYAPLTPANNLSDVSSLSSARSNLGISLTGSGAPGLSCGSSTNNGSFYTSNTLVLYECTNASGSWGWTAVGGAGSNTVSNSLTTNYLPKANGATSIVNSSLQDNGTIVSTTEGFQAALLIDTGAAASSGTACLQINTSGAISNSGAACGSGTTPTFAIGTVTSLSYGSTPTVTETGGPNYTLSFGIPQGAPGSGGGGSGTVVASPQNQIPFYSTSGTSSILSGDGAFTDDGNGNVTVNTLAVGTGGTPTKINVTSQTVATLPASGNMLGDQREVSDGTSSSDCTAGGGTVIHWCFWTGSNWSTSTPAAGMTDPGSNGIVKRTGLNTTGAAVAVTDYMSPSTSVLAAQMPALTGDCTTTAGTVATSCAQAVAILTDATPIVWATMGRVQSNAIVTLAHTTATRAINLTGLTVGGYFTLVIKQDSTGGAALTGGTGCNWYMGGSTGFTASTTFGITSTTNNINIAAGFYDGTNCYVNVR